MPSFPPEFPEDVDDTGFDQVITGTDGKDTLIGAAGRDHIIAGNSDDTLVGMQGEDFLEGGNGNDRLIGGTQIDRLEGGAGDDTYFVGHDTGDIIIDSAGYDTVRASTSQDLRNYTGVEALDTDAGSRRGTTAVGTDGDNVLDVSSWSSVIDAGAGNDTLLGSDYGHDIFIGGLGRDVMDSGNKNLGPPWWGQDMGIDRFDFRAPEESAVGAQHDVIYNFLQSTSYGGDQVNLGAMDANTQINGNQAFTFIADAAFSGNAGELRVEYVDFADDRLDYNLISGDVNGDGVADFEIEVHTQWLNRLLTADNDIIL
jgi:serralysin